MNTLQDEIEAVINGYSRSTAASMIVDMIKDKFDDLVEEMRATDWGHAGAWTDALDDTMIEWINNNL